MTIVGVLGSVKIAKDCCLAAGTVLIPPSLTLILKEARSMLYDVTITMNRLIVLTLDKHSHSIGH